MEIRVERQGRHIAIRIAVIALLKIFFDHSKISYPMLSLHIKKTPACTHIYIGSQIKFIFSMGKNN